MLKLLPSPRKLHAPHQFLKTRVAAHRVGVHGVI